MNHESRVGLNLAINSGEQLDCFALLFNWWDRNLKGLQLCRIDICLIDCSGSQQFQTLLA
jgi:hypothetical protein